MEVIRKLDAYLDGQIPDEVTARRIAAHLDVCRRCGLEARTLTELKASLRRLAPKVDPGTLDRLRSFARGLEREQREGGER
jgi:anti-sigma factor RsiW